MSNNINKAKWIWVMGDFELYHSILLHSRREEFGIDLPHFWDLSTPYPNVSFSKNFSAKEDTSFKVFAHGKGYLTLDDVRHRLNEDVFVSKGDHSVSVFVISDGLGLPCIYINSEYLKTDTTWTSTHMTSQIHPVGAYPEYFEPTDNPEIFKFEYEEIIPKSVKKSKNK